MTEITALIADAWTRFTVSFAHASLLWLLLAIVATGTNLVDFIYGAPADGGFSALQLASFAVRILVAYGLAGIALRRLMGRPANAWQVDRGVFFYLAWAIGLFVLGQGAGVGLTRLLSHTIARVVVDRASLVLAIVVLLGATAVAVDLASLRAVPWMVARTTRLPVAFGEAWRAMCGHWLSAALAYAVLVLPLFACHFGLSAWLQVGAPPARLAWTVFDGLETAALAMMALSLDTAIANRTLPLDYTSI